MSSLSAALFYAAFSAILLGNVLFLTGVWHYSVLRAGLALTPGPIAPAIFAPFAGKVAQRIGPGLVGGAGALFFGVGSLLGLPSSASSPRTGPVSSPPCASAAAASVPRCPPSPSPPHPPCHPTKIATGIGAQSIFRQIGATLRVATFAATVIDDYYNNARWFMIAAALALAVIRHERPNPSAARPTVPTPAAVADPIRPEQV
jgi:hypothetical protein